LFHGRKFSKSGVFRQPEKGSQNQKVDPPSPCAGYGATSTGRLAQYNPSATLPCPQSLRDSIAGGCVVLRAGHHPPRRIGHSFIPPFATQSCHAAAPKGVGRLHPSAFPFLIFFHEKIMPNA